METMENRSIKKIAILGAESTGKTQLCEQLALHFSTAWVPEYARDYFNQSDIYNYTQQDLEHIAQKQVDLESESLLNAKTFLFCDTALITLKIWAELEFGTCPKLILSLMESNRYDYYLITNNAVSWEPDPQRLNKFSREMIFEKNKQEALLEKTPFGIVIGTGESRRLNAIQLLLALQSEKLL
jgi:NadR type nicotinamide-nucleotide adenylyltransferase